MVFLKSFFMYGIFIKKLEKIQPIFWLVKTILNDESVGFVILPAFV